MLVLVTGGAGFIGSHTVDLLLERGHRVRILDNLQAPVHQRKEWPDYVPDAAERLLVSVEYDATCNRALEDEDALLPHAAYQDSLPNFSQFFRSNAAGTALL